MKRDLMFGAAVAAFLLTWPVRAASATTATQALTSRQFLIGSWKCSYSVGPQAGTYTTQWSPALGNRWLKQTYKQVASRTQPGFEAEYLIGYDEAHQAWVRFGAMTTGQYFAIRMEDVDDGGWSWKYVSFFKNGPVRSSDSDATLTKKTSVEYAVDGPTYPAGGKWSRSTISVKRSRKRRRIRRFSFDV